MLWFLCWVLALSRFEQSAAEVTDWMKPPSWSGNFWGPAACRARLSGQLPPLLSSPAMRGWQQWGRQVLRDGDIVFRLGDARTMRGTFPLSLFIARATGSPFSHTGIVAVEVEGPVVYDCSSSGMQRQPFEIWMLDNVGEMGVKRLKPEHRRHIPGILAYSRRIFERQLPFDFEFRMDDQAMYCVELTEKAFRSQGLALSEPIRIGDWEHLIDYPLTALGIQYGSGLVLDRPITLDQPVYVPGNDEQGVWGSPSLETVHCTHKGRIQGASARPSAGLSLKGDVGMVAFVAAELHRSYAQLPIQFVQDLVMQAWHRKVVATRNKVVDTGHAYPPVRSTGALAHE